MYTHASNTHTYTAQHLLYLERILLAQLASVALDGQLPNKTFYLGHAAAF